MRCMTVDENPAMEARLFVCPFTIAGRKEMAVIAAHYSVEAHDILERWLMADTNGGLTRVAAREAIGAVEEAGTVWVPLYRGAT